MFRPRCAQETQDYFLQILIEMSSTINEFKEILARFKRDIIEEYTMNTQDTEVEKKVADTFGFIYNIIVYLLSDIGSVPNSEDTDNIRIIRKLFEPVLRKSLDSSEKQEILHCSKMNFKIYPFTIDQDSIALFSRQYR